MIKEKTMKAAKGRRRERGNMITERREALMTNNLSMFLIMNRSENCLL